MPQQNVAEIYDKTVPGPSDHTLILNTRCQLVYPFSPATWTDLRVGFFLSVCKPDPDDNVITALDETLAVQSGAEDRFWIGLKTNNDLLPLAPNTGFIGFTNALIPPSFALWVSDLVSSDEGIGTTNTNCWRPRVRVAGGAVDDAVSARIADSGANLPTLVFNNVNSHFPQFTDPTHGYATLLMLRLQRPTPTSGVIDVSIKQGTHSGDVLFSNTPTLDILEQNLANYPTVVQTKRANGMVHIPDALYLYWPFHNSRLRVHCLGFMKFH